MKVLLLVALGAICVFAQDTDLLKNFADGNKQFTASVYKELKKSNSGNFLVCPLSVDIVMALVHAGAKGQTATQLSTGLKLPSDTETVQETFKALAPKLQGNEDYQLSSANKIYVKDGFEVSDTYKNVAINSFQSEIQSIDFLQKEAASSEINKWVEKKTNDKIHNLIQPDDLDEDTRLILINAMYFHGKWVNQFNEYATKKRDFYLTKESKVEIDMMEQTNQFRYFECEELNAKFLELPYDGGDVSMTIVLPNEKDGLAALEERIEDVLVRPTNYSYERVHVVLPKFKIETTIKFKPILQSLGIKDAFEDSADFSGIGANAEPLKISKVIQKAFIEVEEKGTTAAAATAVFGMVALSAFDIYPPPKTYEFQADHPYLIYLRLNHIDTTLFVGRVTKF